MEKISIAIIGLGFVGGSMYKSFQIKIAENGLEEKYKVIGYDKYKNVNSLEDCLGADIIFTALPTLFDDNLKSYDNSPTNHVVNELYEKGYRGCIVIKSTVEPTFTQTIATKYPEISFIHNPEFLTARTAYEDFHQQKHIVLGKSLCTDEKYTKVKNLYCDLYKADISECTSTESECMKIFCNSFYAVKIQLFNEFFMTTQSIGANYDTIRTLMLKNGWINPMHTNVPGPDGSLSYGGLCFPKDTLALNEFMKKHHEYNAVLNAATKEQELMRKDSMK